MKALIEDTYIRNNKSSVALLSHSLGCPYTHFFLSKMTQEWKDTYIKVWITIAGAWAGSAKLMRVYASGSNLGFPDVFVEPLKLRTVLRTYESTAFLLPSKDFWDVEEVGSYCIHLCNVMYLIDGKIYMHAYILSMETIVMIISNIIFITYNGVLSTTREKF